MNQDALHEIAKKMVAPGRGLLAADESLSTAGKRLKKIGMENSEPDRRAMRDMLLTTPGMEQFISGVILYEETLFQTTLKDEISFPKLLESKGVIPGIKVDKGAKSLAFTAEEVITEGLDGLRERLAKYYEAGARFSKWRAVIHIGDGMPSNYALRANAHALGRYAALCQEANIVPIVEPEVLMIGEHDIDVCEAATDRTLEAVFHELHLQRIFLEGMILKPNMVVSGKTCPHQADHQSVATATLRTLKRRVSAAVPGIAFLSGGQEDIDATANLDALNRLSGRPWPLTYSFGRALQNDALEAWKGQPQNAAAAQKAFLHRAHMNSLASMGQWSPSVEQHAD